MVGHRDRTTLQRSGVSQHVTNVSRQQHSNLLWKTEISAQFFPHQKEMGSEGCRQGWVCLKNNNWEKKQK